MIFIVLGLGALFYGMGYLITEGNANKMIVEHLQMMSIVAVVNDLDPAKRTNGEFYKTRMFRKHPCTLWMGESFGNWSWTYHMTEYLCAEFEKRFGRQTPLKMPV